MTETNEETALSSTQLLIGGQWTTARSGKTEEVRSPFDGSVVGEVPTAGLEDERSAVIAALDRPIGWDPLRAKITAQTRICIVHTDITRPTPNDRLMPWLLGYLVRNGAAREKILQTFQEWLSEPKDKSS